MSSYDVTNVNMPVMKVDQIVNELSQAYSSLINNDISLKNFPSVMLWGPPGVGKSQAVRQIADRLESVTEKSTKVTDVRLLLFNPVDLRGIPTSNADKTMSVWLKPKIFDMDDSTEVINILFLDEISAAPPSVQAAAYQITLDRVIGEHSLPDNCLVIAAGNRVTDKSVAYKMPKALANRLMHIEVEVSADSWIVWAKAHNINEQVLNYLENNKSALFDCYDDSDALSFATPRSWEMVSNILNDVNDNIDSVFNLISGLVGRNIAQELKEWNESYVIDVARVFLGVDQSVPVKLDKIHSLISAMTVYASEHMYDMDLIANSIRYAKQLPAEYFDMLMRSYVSLGDGFGNRLCDVPEFQEWFSSCKAPGYKTRNDEVTNSGPYLFSRKHYTRYEDGKVLAR